MDKHHKIWFPPIFLAKFVSVFSILYTHFLGIIKPTVSFLICSIKQHLLRHTSLSFVAYSKLLIFIEKIPHLGTSFIFETVFLQKLRHGFPNITNCTLNKGFSSLLKCNVFLRIKDMDKSEKLYKTVALMGFKLSEAQDGNDHLSQMLLLNLLFLFYSAFCWC